jgi:queuine tRNA-ribosyltransferase
VSHSFTVLKACPVTEARAGVLSIPHGTVPTPVFLPVGSQGAVKTLTPDDLKAVGVTIILGNAYHLYLRPGMEVIEKVGGLHQLMSWEGPILTDSGGYQIFSLVSLRRVTDEGVTFRSHVDGSEHFFTPELVIQLQEKLGGDIIMPLDECPPYSNDQDLILEAMRRTHRWAERSLRNHHREEQALYAIVQGGTFFELRRESAYFLTSLGFSGYGIGGLSLGEPKEATLAVLEETVACLPKDKPRYLMGVGSPEDIFEGVSRGVDMFDSALPTRTARNGSLFTALGRHNVQNASYKNLDGPIDDGCDCYTCRNFSAAYLHHLFKSRELLAYRLATIHNLHFIVSLTRRIREAIVEGTFAMLRQSFLSSYQITNEETRIAQKKKWLESRVGLDKPTSSGIVSDGEFT